MLQFATTWYIPLVKLHIVIVDDQIRPILCRPASEIYILIHTVRIGKVSYLHILFVVWCDVKIHLHIKLMRLSFYVKFESVLKQNSLKTHKAVSQTMVYFFIYLFLS